MVRSVVFWCAAVAAFVAASTPVLSPRLDDTGVAALFAPVGLLAGLMFLRPTRGPAAATAFVAVMGARAELLGQGVVATAPFLAIDVLEAVVVATVLRRFGARGFGLHRPNDIGLFAATALTAAALGATAAVGASWLWPRAVFAEVPPARLWLDWFMGDAASFVSVGVATILLGRLGPRRVASIARRRPAEFASALVALLIAVAYDFEVERAFLAEAAAGSRAPHPSLLFLTFPAVVWLSVRFPRLGPALGVCLTAFPAMWLVAAGHGPIWLDLAVDRTLVMQGYVGVTALSALWLSALALRVARRERALRIALAYARRRSISAADFVAGVNHEVRTPLNGVIGALQLLRAEIDGPLPPRSRDLVSAADESASRLGAMLIEFLDVARVRRPAEAPAFPALDLRDAVASAFDVCRPAAEARGVALLDETRDGVILRADPVGLHMALVHLIGNGARHARDGGAVRVRGFAGRAATVVEVADDGTGFDPATPALGRRATRGDQRAGFGLQIVEAVMALHDGRMILASRPGEGARVRLRFPDAGRA